MLGHFAVCLANVVCIGSLAPCSRVATASCRNRRLCALCVSPFPSIRSALNSHASSPYQTPLSPSLLSSFGDMTTCTPPSSSAPSYLPSFISHPLTCAGSAPCPPLSPQHELPMYPIHAISTFGVLCPTSVRHYKIPLVLALVLHSHSHRLRSGATKSNPHYGARFISLR